MSRRAVSQCSFHFCRAGIVFLTNLPSVVVIALLTEERFTGTVIVGHFRAILFQAFCLALAFFCLDGANGQTNPIVNYVEDSPVRSETEQLFEKANELYLKKDYDAALPLLERILLLKENALGPDDPQVADVLSMIGGVYREKGDSARALPY